MQKAPEHLLEELQMVTDSKVPKLRRVTHLDSPGLQGMVLVPCWSLVPGPLIRIVGDKFPGSVKKAIIQALHSLLMRGGTSAGAVLTAKVSSMAYPVQAQSGCDVPR